MLDLALRRDDASGVARENERLDDESSWLDPPLQDLGEVESMNLVVETNLPDPLVALVRNRKALDDANFVREEAVHSAVQVHAKLAHAPREAVGEFEVELERVQEALQSVLLVRHDVELLVVLGDDEKARPEGGVRRAEDSSLVSRLVLASLYEGRLAQNRVAPDPEDAVETLKSSRSGAAEKRHSELVDDLELVADEVLDPQPGNDALDGVGEASAEAIPVEGFLDVEGSHVGEGECVIERAAEVEAVRPRRVALANGDERVPRLVREHPDDSSRSAEPPVPIRDFARGDASARPLERFRGQRLDQNEEDNNARPVLRWPLRVSGVPRRVRVSPEGRMLHSHHRCVVLGSFAFALLSLLGGNDLMNLRLVSGVPRTTSTTTRQRRGSSIRCTRAVRRGEDWVVVRSSEHGRAHRVTSLTAEPVTGTCSRDN